MESTRTITMINNHSTNNRPGDRPTRLIGQTPVETRRAARRNAGATNAKRLISAASFAGVIGGWALMAQHDATASGQPAAQADATLVASATPELAATATATQVSVAVAQAVEPTVTAQAPASATATLQPPQAAATATQAPVAAQAATAVPTVQAPAATATAKPTVKVAAPAASVARTRSSR
jgi:hypothetical protein